MTAFDNLKQIHLGTLEKQKSLRMQAERARLGRLKKESNQASSESQEPTEK